MAVAVVALEILSCLGLGALILRLLKIDGALEAGEHLAFAFALGFGLLGWLVFPLGVWGLLKGPWLFGLLLAGCGGCLLVWRKGLPRAIDKPDAVAFSLLALIVAVLVLDLAEGLSPPGDADTLAYHFTAPKLFLEAGRIEHILRPLDGAIPYLVQMTYLPALALGGEQALTLWTMLSGWAAGALLFVLCRRHLDLNWSLATALIFLGLPATVYAAGSGQIEVRTAMFVMVAAWATARALETGRLKYALLAGIAVGFFGGAKYLGLLFALVCGLTIVFQRRWLVHGAVFSAAALLAGFQWYAWNAVHTGDPFFPMLFQWLGRDDLMLWNKSHDLRFKATFFAIDLAVPRNPIWLFLFPFSATLDPSPIIDAKRVGLGPFGLLVLPFAALGAWKFRAKIAHSPLLVYGALALLYYAFWFFSGSSQRVRHLLPVMPLLLICFTLAAERFASSRRLRMPLISVFAATIFLHMGAQTLFSLKYFNHLQRGEDREAFLHRNIKNYAPVPWINANLSKTDKVLLGERQLFYFLNVPYLFASPHTQAVIDLGEKQLAARLFYRQLKTAGITHVLVNSAIGGKGTKYFQPFQRLNNKGCLELIKGFDAFDIYSRTLPGVVSATMSFDLLKLKDDDCLE